MNIDPRSVDKSPKHIPIKDDAFFDDDFQFKPLTSGLGFHHAEKTAPLKTVIGERSNLKLSLEKSNLKSYTETSLYQNDLSIFYGHSENVPQKEEPKQQVNIKPNFKTAKKTTRLMAYVLDLSFISSMVSLVLVIMARIIDMDLIQAWIEYPNEVTPLVLSLFTGFYLLYFSIFEKSNQSTLGKNLLNIRVLGLDDKSLSFTKLLLRSLVTLFNFISLGLFSYFDLQNKITNSKVVLIK